MRSYLVRAVIVITVFTQGCGTLLPGARRQVDIRKYCFSYDGRKVFYQQDRYDYKILSEKSRDRFYVYVYDVKKRRHRKIARSALMEVSPSGPIVFMGRDWKRKESADLYIYDYEKGMKEPLEVTGSSEKAPYISILGVEWLSDRDLIAEIGLSSENPCMWIGKGDKEESGSIIRETMTVDGNGARIIDNEVELPQRKSCLLTSPDGRYELKEEPFDRYFMFHTSLYLEDKEGKKKIYITKDSRILSIFEGMGYLLKYIGFGILQAFGIK